MPTATITSKGQITLPKAVRDRLRVGPGDRVTFLERPDGSIVVQGQTVDLLSLRGLLKPRRRGVTVEQMNQAIRKRFARR